MNKSPVIIALAVGGLGLGACAGTGPARPVNLAELNARCEVGGASPRLEASRSDQAGNNPRCDGAGVANPRTVDGRSLMRTDMNRAMDQAVNRGY